MRPERRTRDRARRPFRDAELLAGAVDEGFAGRRALEDALSSYERARNEAAGPTCEWTKRLAELRAVSPKSARFFGLVSGSVTPEQFFGPENMERMLGRGDDGARA